MVSMVAIGILLQMVAVGLVFGREWRWHWRRTMVVGLVFVVAESAFNSPFHILSRISRPQIPDNLQHLFRALRQNLRCVVNFFKSDKLFNHGSVLRGHKLVVLCLAMAGNLAFSGSADSKICVWRREEEEEEHMCVLVLTGHTGLVKCLVVKEDIGDGKKATNRLRRGGRRTIICLQRLGLNCRRALWAFFVTVYMM